MIYLLTTDPHLLGKKKTMYHKARRSNDDSLKSRYKRLEAYVQKILEGLDGVYSLENNGHF